MAKKHRIPPRRNSKPQPRQRKKPARKVPPVVESVDVELADTSNGRQTVVGIGASAGGVEAMLKLLQTLTADTGLAYVLVQHLAPKHESFLAELLRANSKIPVVQATEQMPILANRLHVIPPNVQM